MSMSLFISSREFRDSISPFLYNLTYFQSSLFATVLEDAITEVRILSDCNNELRLRKTEMEMDYLLALKYNIEQPVNDGLEGINPKEIGCSEYKLHKLYQDRNYILDTLKSTYLDLSLNKNFKALANQVNKTEEINAYRLLMIDDEIKNKLNRRDLNRQLRQQRNHIKSSIYDTDVVIENLKCQVEDSDLNAKTRGRYISNWQIARTEQHNETIRIKESRPANVIEYYKKRAEHEQRVHTEIEMLINIFITDLLKQVESWMDKYDKDTESMDLKIQIKKNEYQIALDQRIGLEEMLETHEKLLNNWVQFKEDREKARQYHDKMTKSAITVQAWWRGLLVRMQLGPYKVVRKRAPPPAGGKGKKK